MAGETWSPGLNGAGVIGNGLTGRIDYNAKPEGEGWQITGYRTVNQTVSSRNGNQVNSIQVPIYTRMSAPTAAPAPTPAPTPTTPSYTPKPAVPDNFNPSYTPKPAVDTAGDAASKKLTENIINNVKPPDTSQYEAQLKALQEQLVAQQAESQRSQLAITTQLQKQLESQQAEAARQQQALTQQFQSLIGGQQQQYSDSQLKIKSDYESQLANVQKSQQQLMAQLEQDYKRQMAEMQYGSQSQLSAVQDDYQRQIAEMQAGSQNQISSVQKAYQDQIGRLNLQISAFGDREQQYQNQIGNMQRSYQDQIGSLQRSYQDQLGSLNNRILEMNNTRNQDGWRAKAAMQIGSRGADSVQTDQYSPTRGTGKLNRQYFTQRSSGSDSMDNLLINQNLGIGGLATNPLLIGGVNL